MLRPEQDAFGRIIWDHFHHRAATEVVERDDGYIDVSGGARTYFSEHRDWPEFERRAMRLVRGRVLDVGCGAGGHALYLQSRGFDVTGIDSSPLAVRVCRLRGVRRCVNLSLAGALAGPARLGPGFDTVLMMCNNLGLLESPSRARALLRRMLRVTRPGALIIGSTLDPYDTTSAEHRSYHRRNRRLGRPGGQARIRVRYRSYATPWFYYLMVSRPELRGILAGTGWSLQQTLGSPDNRYIAVIERRQTAGT